MSKKFLLAFYCLVSFAEASSTRARTNTLPTAPTTTTQVLKSRAYVIRNNRPMDNDHNKPMPGFYYKDKSKGLVTLVLQKKDQSFEDYEILNPISYELRFDLKIGSTSVPVTISLPIYTESEAAKPEATRSRSLIAKKNDKYYLICVDKETSYNYKVDEQCWCNAIELKEIKSETSKDFTKLSKVSSGTQDRAFLSSLMQITLTTSADQSKYILIKPS